MIALFIINTWTTTIIVRHVFANLDRYPHCHQHLSNLFCFLNYMSLIDSPSNSVELEFKFNVWNGESNFF